VTFRRTFTERLMQFWREMLAVMEETNLSDEADALIWCCTKSGVFSTQSSYSVISYRGVTPLYIPAVWNICVPPKIHLFLWLLSHNKLATVDNLNKKGMNKPVQCRLCGEDESVDQLFFCYVVVRNIWEDVSEFLGVRLGADYIPVASKWLSKEKYFVTNLISSALLRGIWLTRNDFVFNGQAWLDVKMVWRKIRTLSMEWKILCRDQKEVEMERWLSFLESLIRRLLRIKGA
jgi:hypothetical protein